jgi:hypothetical protein
MRGRIKLGRWLPFRARQLLVPHQGTVWAARIAGIIRGSDHYVDGDGGMDWKLLGVVRVAHADGPDVARSAAERAAGESIWTPAATVADPSAWQAIDDRRLLVHLDVDGHTVELHHELDHQGRLHRSQFDRWGDPDNEGSWALRPFGVEITGHRSFDGVTIPHRGRAGWHFGTDRWPAGVFFEFEITRYQLAT